MAAVLLLHRNAGELEVHESLHMNERMDLLKQHVMRLHRFYA
jgi:hypothetical protein